MRNQRLKIFRARHLRKNPTGTESDLWSVLRNRQFFGFRFRRQHPIGPYIVDFVCLQSQLVIELDGAQHISSVEYDATRTNYLNGHGFSVVRFWNNQVFTEMDGVEESILHTLA
jgi:very-short-patch-repair endonuclease